MPPKQLLAGSPTGGVSRLQAVRCGRVRGSCFCAGAAPGVMLPVRPHVGQHRRRRVPRVAHCHNTAWPMDGARPAGLHGALLGLLAAQAIGGPLGSAEASDRIAEFAASGLIFKDSVEVLAVDDSAVQGVTVYISDFRRSLTDKLARDFFSEPSQAKEALTFLFAALPEPLWLDNLGVLVLRLPAVLSVPPPRPAFSTRPHNPSTLHPAPGVNLLRSNGSANHNSGH